MATGNDTDMGVWSAPDTNTDPKTLFISDIPYDMSKQKLKEILKDLHVRDPFTTKFRTNSKNRQTEFEYLTFATEKAADDALLALQGAKICGNYITVRKATKGFRNAPLPVYVPLSYHRAVDNTEHPTWHQGPQARAEYPSPALRVGKVARGPKASTLPPTRPQPRAPHRFAQPPQRSYPQSVQHPGMPILGQGAFSRPPPGFMPVSGIPPNVSAAGPPAGYRSVPMTTAGPPTGYTSVYGVPPTNVPMTTVGPPTSYLPLCGGPQASGGQPWPGSQGVFQAAQPTLAPVSTAPYYGGAMQGGYDENDEYLNALSQDLDRLVMDDV